MKSPYYLLLLFAVLCGCSSTRPKKSDVVSLSFSYDSTVELEYENTIPLQVTLNRRDGKVKRAKRNNSDRVTVLSPQGVQIDKHFRFNREMVCKNGNSADLHIFYNKDSSVTANESIEVPYITALDFKRVIREVSVGKIYQPKIEITHSSGKKRVIGLRGNSRTRSQKTTESGLLQQLQISAENLRIFHDGITPKIAMDTLITEGVLKATPLCDSTLFDTLTLAVSYNIQKHFPFNGKSGYRGGRGSHGQNGSIGSDGGDGGHGGNGQSGSNGRNVILYVLSEEQAGKNYLKIWAIGGNKKDSVIINAQSGQLHVSANGGRGGDGGNGGNGGDGGDSDSTHSEGRSGDGGNGGHGGNGGRGGEIRLYCDQTASQFLHTISYENFGGQGGSAGKGGSDGSKGRGPKKEYKTKAGAVLGAIGSVARAIFIGSSGDDGKAGFAGESGPPMEIEILSAEKMQFKIQQLRKNL